MALRHRPLSCERKQCDACQYAYQHSTGQASRSVPMTSHLAVTLSSNGYQEPLRGREHLFLLSVAIIYPLFFSPFLQIVLAVSFHSAMSSNVATTLPIGVGYGVVVGVGVRSMALLPHLELPDLVSVLLCVRHDWSFISPGWSMTWLRGLLLTLPEPIY
jgi:hypothetical protein